MMVPRVLIGTPCRDSATIPYLNGLWDIAKSITECDVVPAIAKATYINIARNDLVEKARAEQCSEIIFWDADVGGDATALRRLRSHDVPIVAGIYSKRVPGPPAWTAFGEKDSKPDENGLQACTSLPTGFLRVKMEVFDELDHFFPQRRFKHEGDKARTEYFPLSLVEKDGWMHPAERTLADISSILARFPSERGSTEVVQEIVRLMGQEQPLASLVGEDIGWSRLCKAAGFTLWADVGLRLRHWGEIGFPAEQTEL